MYRLRIYDLPQDCFTCTAPTLKPCTSESTSPKQAHQEQPSTSYSQHEQTAHPEQEPQRHDTDLWGGPGLQPWNPSQPDTMGVALRVHEGETVYDYAWFSQMSATDPQSCCFATTTRVSRNHESMMIHGTYYQEEPLELALKCCLL